MDFKGDLIEYKCLCCDKSYHHKFDEKSKELFFNTYKFSNHSNNKFKLLLLKGIYLYEYMDDWEKFNKKSLPEKKWLLQSLNYGRCYWSRLRARKKGLQRLWNKDFTRISWLLCSKKCAAICWCISDV